MPTPVTLSPSDLQLPSFYRWERERADKIFLTQPLGGGGLRDITWARRATRPGASPPGSRRKAGRPAAT